MCSFQESAGIGTSIFLFHAPHLVLVPIFVENRTFLNFGGVWSFHGSAVSGPIFSDLS